MACAFDTNVLVDLMRQDRSVRARYDSAVEADEAFQMSAFVLQELLFGVEASRDSSSERSKLDRLLQEIEVVPFERSDAEVGGRVQAEMKRIGRKAPSGDFIVGVHALARGCQLVTANTRHFENIPGLQLLNWRLPPEDTQDLDHA